MDFFIGQICMFPWNWVPRGWAKCDGTLLSITENNSALFAYRNGVRGRWPPDLRSSQDATYQDQGWRGRSLLHQPAGYLSFAQLARYSGQGHSASTTGDEGLCPSS